MPSGSGNPSPTPRIFRILVAASDLAESRRFYETLLGIPGRDVAEGRVYFDCGSVILGVLDFSSRAESERPRATEAIYLATTELEKVHERARRLGALSAGLIHDDPEQPLGKIVVRPWGERSFYADDPAGNPLCFVDESTLFTGRPEQVAALRRATGG
jgi:catechol 2,3-dioxygenase-like lactoylglutathione lyase family enzyme